MKEPRNHATFRKLPDLSSLPEDEIEQELILLLYEHPEISDQFSPSSELTPKERLLKVKEALGIKPFRTNILPYLGDDEEDDDGE